MRSITMAWGIAIIGLVPVAASAQSLAALAAQESARRAALSEPSPVYTNQDLVVWPAPTPPHFPPMPFVPELERTPLHETVAPQATGDAFATSDSVAASLVTPWWMLAGWQGQSRQSSWNRRARAASGHSPFDASFSKGANRLHGGEARRQPQRDRLDETAPSSRGKGWPGNPEQASRPRPTTVGSVATPLPRR